MRVFLPHLGASILALGFAWLVSRTAAVTTGLQFVAPLILVILAHLAWEARDGLKRGYALAVLGSSATTGALLILVFFAAQMLAPMPSEASTGETILGVLFCVFILIVVLGVIALILWLIFKLIGAAWRRVYGDDDDLLKDGGTLVVVFALLSLGSLEGVAYRLAPDGTATATRHVDAPPEAVWAAMAQATSPTVALPNMLMAFPQPVAVLTDEGVTMGANRRVEIAGREGRGVLHLKVVSRTGQEVRFETQSNTSPMAGWIDIQALTYTVTPEGTGTHLDVTLDYDRLLAPAWVFEPMMEAAATLAMGVLASDTAQRSGR